jgi:hypothetical protein
MQQGYTLHPLAILAIALGGMVIAYFFYLNYLRGKHVKMAAGKIWCDFYTRGGDCYDLLCSQQRGQVKAVGSGITDKDGKEKKVKIDSYIKAPDGHRIGEYYILSDMTFNAKWPPGKPRSTQVIIRKTAFIENMPLPVVQTDPEKWNPEKYREITAYLNAISKDEAFGGALLQQSKEALADLKTTASRLKDIPTMKYACFAAAAGGGIAAVLTLTAMGKLDFIIKLCGG